MTTRRFPRTLLEAFGCDARSAVAITRYRRPLSSKVADLMTAAVIAATLVVLALAYFEVLA